MTLTATEPWGAAQDGSPTCNPKQSEQDYAACIGVRSLPDLVTNENAAMLGFKDLSEVSRVTIGVPFKNVYLVDVLDLRGFDPATDDNVVPLLKPMKINIYPLLTGRQDDENGKLKTRSALVVSLRKDKVDETKSTWKPTNWGLVLLAQAMTEYRESFKPFASGVIVWIPGLNLHFLGDQVTDNLKLIPLANRKTYGLTKGVPISAKIVFALYAREAKSLDVDQPG
jgi:hypothetical protein